MTKTFEYYNEIPAICNNPQCDNYQGWETYEQTEVLTEKGGDDYVICHDCLCKVYID